MAFSISQQRVKNQYYEDIIVDEVMPLKMMQIPGGTFLMGSPEDELERLDREGPQHEVMLSQFFMAKYPVTQAQWRAIASMFKVSIELSLNPSSFEGELRPVEKVNWFEAVEFCDRLTLHTNRQYRLPSEAEWEYACRAGTTTPFHFGPTLSTDYANYNGGDEQYGAYGPGTKGDDRGTTTPVDEFDCANAYGLCDMHGNVWEWCQDHWHETYESSPSNGQAWVEDIENDNHSRVRRGGSWIDDPRYCRSAYRNYGSPDDRYVDLGFRVVCSAPRAV